MSSALLNELRGILYTPDVTPTDIELDAMLDHLQRMIQNDNHLMMSTLIAAGICHALKRARAAMVQAESARPQPFPEWVREHLCWFDPRSVNYSAADDEHEGGPYPPRQLNCACDPCFHGRDRLAVLILDGAPARPQPDAGLVEALRELLKAGAHDGPCTNLDENGECDGTACTLHLAASERRREAARDALARAEAKGV